MVFNDSDKNLRLRNKTRDFCPHIKEVTIGRYITHHKY